MKKQKKHKLVVFWGKDAEEWANEHETEIRNWPDNKTVYFEEQEQIELNMKEPLLKEQIWLPGTEYGGMITMMRFDTYKDMCTVMAAFERFAPYTQAEGWGWTVKEK